MRLTPTRLAAAYEYLRACPPFAAWKLPPAEEVEFAVTNHRDREGDHTIYCNTNEHIIRVSEYHVHNTVELMDCMAHEMIHARQTCTSTEARGARHNDEFNRLNRLVCRYHGWPVEVFH